MRNRSALPPTADVERTSQNRRRVPTPHAPQQAESSLDHLVGTRTASALTRLACAPRIAVARISGVQPLPPFDVNRRDPIRLPRYNVYLKVIQAQNFHIVRSQELRLQALLLARLRGVRW